MHSLDRTIAAGIGVALCLAVALPSLATTPDIAAEAMAAPPPAQRACPAELLPEGTLCFNGHDGEGSAYWVALPRGWSHDVLVVDAHDEPANAPSLEEHAPADLDRASVTVKAGYAWAATSYRHGGWGVTMAAQDVERMRRIFIRFFGNTRRTVLQGHGYGAGVAAKAVELYGARKAQPTTPYDGVLLTNGFLAGGVRDHEYLLDLRVVYQFFCHNHPRPDEPQYPLWMGLPKDGTLTREELAKRIDECTGIGKPRTARTLQQQANLAAIVQVARIPERSLVANMTRATWLLQDIAQNFLGGRNPWGNTGASYEGSEQDALLNAKVLRYAADASAAARLEQDSAPTGKVSVPIVSLHAIDDPQAFVEFESFYRATLERAGTSQQLLQVFTDKRGHGDLGGTELVAALQALLAWIDSGDKPSPLAVAQRCIGLQPQYGTSCRMAPNYLPTPLQSRVAPRPR